MTDVDFFRAFAADTTVISGKSEYYYEYTRQSLDFSGLFSAESENDTQLKILHYHAPKGIKFITNESGNVHRVRFRGSLLMVRIGNPQSYPDVQRGNSVNDGIYESQLKPIIDSGGIPLEMANYNSRVSTGIRELEFGEADPLFLYPIGKSRVVNGIWMSYRMEIEHQTFFNP